MQKQCKCKWQSLRCNLLVVFCVFVVVLMAAKKRREQKAFFFEKRKTTNKTQKAFLETLNALLELLAACK